ncbi:uncharacterized protein JCM6883_006685 [Sporobolomyces salmoneus]|uniref:uncharacterized protein n=1 Tax=Sporobolomyces salmoneus TaxID=183962 RepID=UPI003172D1C8
MSFSPSPQSTSLLSLSPELLLKIFSIYPPVPFPPGRLTLRSLCLVDRTTSEVARSALYRHLYLPLTFEYNDSNSIHAKLVRTLVEEGRCAEAVRSLRITLGKPKRSDLLQFAHVLSRLTNLQRIFTSWEDPEVSRASLESIVAEFCGVITRNCRQLQALELPNVTLSESSISRICESLQDLEVWTLKAPAKAMDSNLAPKSKLRSLTLLSRYHQDGFDLLTSSSRESLTTITLSLYSGHFPQDLSNFPNLRILRLNFENPTLDGDEYSSDNEDEPRAREKWARRVAREIAAILTSVQNSPIDSMSLSFNSTETSLELSSRPILKSLPHTLRTLSISCSLLGGEQGVNRRLLFPSTLPTPCPELKLLKILPPGHTRRLSRVDFELMVSTKTLVKGDVDRLGLNTEIRLATNQGDSFRMKDALDPGEDEEW